MSDNRRMRGQAALSGYLALYGPNDASDDDPLDTIFIDLVTDVLHFVAQSTGDPRRALRVLQWAKHHFEYESLEYAPENCPDCGAPTNDAEGGRCAACSAR